MSKSSSRHVDDEVDFQSIGFMFDSLQSRSFKSFTFTKDIKVEISTIGEDPGHVQSGQYLWPAAEFACWHLIRNWSLLKTRFILELGAGCGLTGIVAAKLEGSKKVVFSDYDPGCLDIISKNIVENDLLIENTTYSTNNQHCVCDVVSFEWGSNTSPLLRSIQSNDDAITDSTDTTTTSNNESFGLILGTDLLYCKEVVSPLFHSVNKLINQSNGIFVLVSSFDTGGDIHQEVEICTKLLGFDVEIVSLLDSTIGSLRIEYFRKIKTLHS